ncbi:MAG: hypothetical protein PF508_00995 [Spirochaeta sp.]|jgi:hypothetical protein|nr:hypothetical protein [Spirochaeta sp.]
MKKLFVSLIILLIAGAVVFGFGYVPIRLEPGTQALMFSRTSGWDSETLRPGAFAWRWQLLVPKNVTLYHFPMETRTLTVSNSTALPSADLYRDYLEGTPSFEQRVELRIRYRLSDTGITELAPSGLRPEGLDGWYDDFDDRISSVVLDTVSATLDRMVNEGFEGSLTDAVLDPVEARIEERFPEITLQTVVPEEIALPDLELYALARETYRAVQEQRENILREFTAATTSDEARRDQRLETLARYGEILDRHPVLLEYLEIAAQHESDPLNIQQLQSVIE